MTQPEHAATGAGQQFHVLFRAEWTRNRWVRWNATFSTVNEANRAIDEREAETGDRDVQRIAMPEDALIAFGIET